MSAIFLSSRFPLPASSCSDPQECCLLTNLFWVRKALDFFEVTLGGYLFSVFVSTTPASSECWRKSGLTQRTGWVFLQGECWIQRTRTQKLITWSMFGITKAPFYFLVIKRKYFSALGWSRISKGSQQRFHHCTLKHTFQRNCLLFLVNCKTNTRGQGLHFLAVLAPRSCCPGLTHKALDEGKLSNLEPVNKPALTSYGRLLRMFLCY